MNITFGMSLDGAEWSQKSASLGEIKVGPQQFLALLESRLGLDGVKLSAPERINEYMQKIRRMNPAWCRTSFELDSWSTAKQMLAWRDELLENGWGGKIGGSERLDTLASLESAQGTLAPGMPDRLKSVLTELQKYHFSDELSLQDSSELLPFLWQKIVNQLEADGMTVRTNVQNTACQPEKIILSGADEFVLAKECVRFLSSGANHKTAVICEGDSSLLDGALHRNGLGSLNSVENSRWRESLQILPLWLETLWKPFYPQRFLELLLLPCSPIPKSLVWELVNALQKEPGYGGEAWNTAWQNVQEKFRKDGENDVQNPDLKKLAEVWTILNKRCFYAEQSVSVGDISFHCDFLIKRLAVQMGKHPELSLVIEHAKTLKKILADKTIVKQMEVARILDSIISTGTAGDPALRERNDFAVFSNPGLIDRDFDTVVWWNFIDRGAANTTNWTAPEIAAMPGYNRTTLRQCENLSWNNAVRHAAKNIVLLIPQRLKGEAVFPHPLLDELEIPEKNRLTPEKLVNAAGFWMLADRQKQLMQQPLFTPSASPRIEANRIRPVRCLSYSQVNTLITCPFQWFMQDYLGLRMPPAMTVPTGPVMLGTLAHKVIEEIYQGKETLTVEEAVHAADVEFKRLVPAMAAEFLLDGRSVERRRIHKTLCDAVETLVSEINTRHLLVKGNEKELHGVFDGMDFVGFSDIYLEDTAGKRFVIDMKWSSSSFFEKHLREDKALQLATYSWLLDADQMDIRCAYFLFPKKQLVYDSKREWKNVWENAKAAWEQRFSEIHAGILERGIQEEKDLKDSTSALPLTAGCSFCDYAALCAVMED